MRRPRVLGVPIDPLRRADVLERLSHLIEARLPGQVVTLNPEFLVAAGRNHRFRQALATAELAVADGIGIRAAAAYTRWPAPGWQPARFVVTLFQGLWVGLAVLIAPRLLADPIPETVTGVDLVDDLARAGAAHGWRFYLVGGDPGRAEQAKEVLTARYPGLLVVGAEEGIPKPHRREHEEVLYLTTLVERIRQAKPDVLCVAFGAPKQDRFIAEHKAPLGVPVMIGVGGAFDFITGAVRRAPRWLRAIGFEWLWRLVVEPWRWRRILTAVIVFPWHVFIERQHAR